MTSTSLLDPAVVQPHAAELIARDKSPRGDLLRIQQQRLGLLLRHATSASPFYRETIGRQVASGASLEELPVLTKRTLMDQWDRIVTDSRVRLRDVEAHLAGDRRGELLFGDYRPFATGGTTGERTVVIYDRDGWLWTIANMMRWVNTIGAGPGARVVGIGAPTPLHITNRAFAELQAGKSNAPRLSVLTPLPELVAQLNDYQPEMIITYPSFARRLAEEQEAGRLRIRPARVASTAEVLTKDVRALVLNAWGARVIDSYGTTEGGLLGTECDAATGIHIAEDIIVYEVVDQSGRRVPEGTPGSRILVTNLQPAASAHSLRDLRHRDTGQRTLPVWTPLRARHGGRRPARRLHDAAGAAGRDDSHPRRAVARAARRRAGAASVPGRAGRGVSDAPAVGPA
jgi:phenylacetate-coenzyme A ligase PaaK-like adenylate-forming protein